jgi:hypothetical protein
LALHIAKVLVLVQLEPELEPACLIVAMVQQLVAVHFAARKEQIELVD